MTILLRQVKIADTHSKYNGKVKDILIQDQKIIEVSDKLTTKADQVLDLNGVMISPGWVDPFVNLCDPGFEHLESLETGAAAAQNGGFTTIFTLPNTAPVIDNKSQVHYVLQKGTNLAIQVYPIGALSKKLEGKELAEMIDMHSNGATAFSDGLNPVQNSLLFLKALQYVKAFEGVIIQMPIDKSIGSMGLMNEGVLSTQLGLPGIPAIAEELLIARDIELLRYTGSKLHITGVSTAKGISLIETAKKEGLSISCSVTPYHLFFNEEDLNDYNTLLKVFPPLRTKKDQLALIDAVEKGMIDCISAHHFPQDWDGKTVEFEHAKPGMACIETAYAAIQEKLPGLNPDKIASLFSSNARAIFNLPKIVIEEGAIADLTLFNNKMVTFIEQKDSKSKSANSPFWGIKLQGKVIGTIVKNKIYLNQ